MPNKDFWKGRKVLITGHRGFIGSWLCGTLYSIGAKLYGADINSSRLYRYFDFGDTNIVNIQNSDKINWRVQDAKPDVVFHLAAQPIVAKGESNTLDTFLTNVTGTAMLLQAVEQFAPEAVFINMSTDKVYAPWSMPLSGYTEESPLGSDSPYACSKICAEDVVDMYRQRGLNTVTIRAGNVFGGGDFGYGRLVPDVINSLNTYSVIRFRNAEGSRPYQYVLNVVYALLTLAEARYKRELFKPWYNVGVDKCISNFALAQKLADAYGIELLCQHEDSPYRETHSLALDCTAYNKEFGKLPFSLDYGIKETVQVYKDMKNHGKRYTGKDLFMEVWK